MNDSPIRLMIVLVCSLFCVGQPREVIAEEWLYTGTTGG